MSFISNTKKDKMQLRTASLTVSPVRRVQPSGPLFPSVIKWNDLDEYVDLNNIFNEIMDIITDKRDLKNIGEIVDTTLQRENGHLIGFKYFLITANIRCHIN